jgi:hypothetical protein
MTRKYVFVVALLAGCDPGPCLELEKGDRLAITITSRTVTCTNELDLQQERRLVATLREPADNEHTTCQYWTADFERIGRWTWTRRTTVDFQGSLGGNYDMARDDGCEGRARVVLHSEEPPAIGTLDVRFDGIGADDTCPRTCIVDLDVDVNKL